MRALTSALLSCSGRPRRTPATTCDNAPDGTPCPDGDLCNGDETLPQRHCSPGIPLSCNDSNGCTDDICDAGLGCLHTNNSASCSDGNPCTTGDVCNGGHLRRRRAEQRLHVVRRGGDHSRGRRYLHGIDRHDGLPDRRRRVRRRRQRPERVYRWTPTTSSQAVVSTCSDATLFNTRVYVFQDTCPGTVVACNDDAPGCSTGAPSSDDGSKIQLTVTANETYYIVVDGVRGSAGRLQSLRRDADGRAATTCARAASNATGTDVALCGGGTCSATCLCEVPPGGLPDLEPEITDVSLDVNTTAASGDVAEGCAESTSGLDLLRFGVKSRNVGTSISCSAIPQCPLPCDDHPLAVCGNPDFMCSPAAGHNHPHYANYSRYELIDGTGQAIVLGHKFGHCLRDTECATPVYTCTFQGLTVRCADEYGSNLGCQYLDVTGIPDGGYRLRGHRRSLQHDRRGVRRRQRRRARW